MTYGLKTVTPQLKDYQADGKIRLGGTPLNPSGQWDEWLPPDELQSVLGVDPQACATFGTLNCVEALARFIYKESPDYSDRFLAKISGTTIDGNDPHTVAETLRKKGSVNEEDWPSVGYTPVSWEGYYADIPRSVETLALEFPARFNFGHQWVSGQPWKMMEALKYSPLGVGVYAWVTDDDGIYYRPSGAGDVHWVMIYGWGELPDGSMYWKCFDSYDNTHKRLRWDFGFSMVKQYTLAKQVIDETAWGKFKTLFRRILGFTPLGGEGLQGQRLWDTKDHIRRNVRVMCDEAGLSWSDKNILCACIRQESNWNPKAVGENRCSANETVWSRDWGLVQINDHKGWWIGPGLYFASTDEVLNKPEKSVKFMIAQFKAGNKKFWASYTTKAYLKWLPQESLPSKPY